VIDAAMRLQHRSSSPVAVSEIAAEAGMTAAAVYYHYPTKDDILLEGLALFSDALLEEVFSFLSPAMKRAPSELPLHLLEWLDGERIAAAVWFAHSNGLSMAVEALRRETYEGMLDALVNSVRKARPDCGLAAASVIAAALTSLLEVSARAWLSDDEALVGDAEQFRAAVAGLGERIVNSAHRSSAADAGRISSSRRSTSRRTESTTSA
jgi:AcrR family transcriptional regulator